MSKKIMSVMLAIFMLASLCVVGVTSASAAYNPDTKHSVYATGGENKSLKTGEEVTLTLTLEPKDNRFIQNGQFEFFFNRALFDAKFDINDPFVDYDALFPVVGDDIITGGAVPVDGNDTLGVIRFNFTKVKGYNVEKNDPQCRLAVFTFTAKQDIADLGEVEFVCEGIEMLIFKEAKPSYIGGEETASVFLDNNQGVNSDYVDSYSLVLTGGTPIVEPTTESSEATTESSEATTESSEATTESSEATTEATTDPSESSEATEPSQGTTDPSEGTTASTTAAATTEAPAGGSQQTGQTTTAIALVVVALMAAGVVIFARKKATK